MSKKLLIGTGIFLIVLIAGWLGFDRGKQYRADEREFQIIQEVVSQQSFSAILERGWRGKCDCYPEGSSKVFCNAVIYNVSKEDCLKVGQMCASLPIESDDSECGPVYATVQEGDGEIIKIYVGQGSSPEVYWVQFWLE